MNLSEILETSQFPSKKGAKDRGGKIIAGGFWLIKFGHAVLSLATCLPENGNKNTFDIVVSQRVSLYWKCSIILFAANPHAKFDRRNLNASIVFPPRDLRQMKRANSPPYQIAIHPAKKDERRREKVN